VVGGAGRQPPRGPVADVSVPALPTEATRTGLASALYVGDVRHRRHRPRVNAFRYRTYHALLDIDELPQLDRHVRGFGYNRRAVVGFHDADHLGPLPLPVRDKLERWLGDRGVELPDGPVRVLTNLRVLGHVFDPVSWWFCHHPDGRLALVVAEVNNTFGESHCYLLDRLEHRANGTVRAHTAKRFHVSPFLPVEGLAYRFTFASRPDALTAHMDVFDADGKLFEATQAGRRVPLTSRSLATTLVTHPLMTLRTVALIHLQAVRLACKRVPFHRKPMPPDDGYQRPATPVQGRSRRSAAHRRQAGGARESILRGDDDERSADTKEPTS
jgi:DUF1365 family protein